MISNVRPIVIASLATGFVALIASPALAQPSHRSTAKAGSEVKVPEIGKPGNRLLKRVSPRDFIKWSWKLRADRTGDNDGLNQTKFAFAPGAAPAGRALNGGNSITGFLGSTSTGRGVGTSNIRTRRVQWNVTATGSLGGPEKHKPKWSTWMSGKDPFYITVDELGAADLLLEQEIDVWFPMTLSGGEVVGEEANFGWEASLLYQDLEYDLFSLHADEGGFDAQLFDTPFEFELWSMIDLDATEDHALSVPIDGAGIERMLLGDLDDGVMDTRLNLGILVRDLSVADIIASGAAIGLRSEAGAGAAVPAPATLALFGLGLGVATRRRSAGAC
ncbi:MAG: PEP-CTERM sorting domain-containing protein [Phycisphaerales bacterium]|jgi:hypothetical protein